jgi:hypothetical protein
VVRRSTKIGICIADHGKYRPTAGSTAEPVISSVELIIQPDAHDFIGYPAADVFHRAGEVERLSRHSPRLAMSCASEDIRVKNRCALAVESAAGRLS